VEGAQQQTEFTTYRVELVACWIVGCCMLTAAPTHDWQRVLGRRVEPRRARPELQNIDNAPTCRSDIRRKGGDRTELVV
jgi:hypothetical protein